MRLLFICAVLLCFNCDQGKTPVEGITEFQRKMNADFKDASKSPLKKKDLKDFDGLDFFPVDSSYVVRAKLKRKPNCQWFKMRMTDGAVSEERIYGVLDFELKDKHFKLNVYQGKELMDQPGWEDYLFLPFLDDTNGNTTYGGGRYVDLRIPKNDTITIDFNTAYSPYCAYNENYSCPIVPRENYLDIKVKAGVMSFESD